jgi:hypothetical protein
MGTGKMRDMPDPPAAQPPVAAPAEAAVRPFTPDAVHLLRTTQQVQYQLSQMADQKASMLLGITFVIFTIAVGQGRAGATQAPILILGGAAFVAALLTVLAVLPSIKPPPLGAPGSDNILFFGVFAQIPQEEYVQRLLGSLHDPRSVFEAFARDIHQNGRVLAGKKYRLLGYAYRVLLTGLVASFVAFVAPYVLKLAERYAT